MKQPQTKNSNNPFDRNELDYAETVYVRDIENRVFQGIVLRCLSGIKGIALVEGNFIDSLLGRGNLDGLKGIHAEQDSKQGAVKVKVEVNVIYGISIPEKAEEIQTKISEEIIKLTGLHVSSIHVVFKNVIPPKIASEALKNPEDAPAICEEDTEELTEALS